MDVLILKSRDVGGVMDAYTTRMNTAYAERVLGHLTNRATKVDIDNADPVFLDQTVAYLCHRLGVVVPDLHGQRTSFLGNPSKTIGMLGFVLIHPDKTSRIDHLSSQQTDPAELTDDLTKGGVGEPRHRRLQDGRVNHDVADAQLRGLHR